MKAETRQRENDSRKGTRSPNPCLSDKLQVTLGSPVPFANEMHGQLLIRACKFLFVFLLLLFLHLQLNTVFCHGDAIPLLGLWGFRLVSLVQNNEHKTFTPPPYAKSREELELVLVLIV